MTRNPSDFSLSARAGDMELLENRQLFAGYTVVGPGYFPGLQQVAQFVEIDRGMPLNFGFSPRFQHGDFSGNLNSGNSSSNSSASDSDSSSASTANASPVTRAQSDDNSLQSVAAAPRSTLETAEGSASDNKSDNTAVALVKSDDASVAPAASTPVTTPTPIVKTITPAGSVKVFSDRPVTAAIAAQTTVAPVGGGLMNLLTAQKQSENAMLQPDSTVRPHHATETAQADTAATELSIHRAQTPASSTLATLPTGGLINQPLWQRIAAASATVVILSVSWMLRRKRNRQSNAVREA